MVCSLWLLRAILNPHTYTLIVYTFEVCGVNMCVDKSTVSIALIVFTINRILINSIDNYFEVIASTIQISPAIYE